MKKLITLIFAASCAFGCHEKRDNLSVFPLEHYSQTISDWINPTNSNYHSLLLDKALQKKYSDNLYKHLYGKFSPWNEEHIHHILNQPPEDNLFSTEKNVLRFFSNRNKSALEIGYGENYRPYDQAWIESIAKNIPLDTLNTLTYQASNRGIAINNALARALPTHQPHFYSYHRAGQGYPFDNLQISALWVGTPVYIFAESIDHAWDLVLTPDYIGWVNSQAIAKVDSHFISIWTAAAKKQLIAITKTETPIIDTHHQFHFLAYVGSLFPAGKKHTLLIPIQTNTRNATIGYALFSEKNSTPIPLTVTPEHMASIMQTLIGRPYGWGNLYFLNDCSSELKSLFTPFGIWLPRHSSDQVYVGKMLDVTKETPQERLNTLLDTGRGFMTLAYVGNHIMLYIGKYPNPYDKHHTPMAMTYQDVWGLKPTPPVRRAVIGKSVLFPLLLNFPEDHDLSSQADRKYFQISYLDESKDLLNQIEQLDLRKLMLP